MINNPFWPVFFTFFWQPSSWYSTLRIKKIFKVPSNQSETVTTDFVSFKNKLQDHCISKYAKWFVCLKLDQPIFIISLIFFIVWKAKRERFNVGTPASFTTIIEHLQLILGVRLPKCHHLLYLKYIFHRSKQSYDEIWDPKYFHIFFILREWLLQAYCQSMIILILSLLSSFLHHNIS